MSIASTLLLRFFAMADFLSGLAKTAATGVPGAPRCAPRRAPVRLTEGGKNYLEVHQPRGAGGNFEIAAASVPVRQHPALAAAPVHLELVAARSMGMAVDQAADAVAAQR